MYYFATFFDKNYLSRGLVLYNSLKENSRDFKLFVLCLDNYTFTYFENNAHEFPEVNLITLQEIEDGDSDLRTSKNNRTNIEYYFTLSPCLPLYLLKKYSISHICTLDADILFLHSPQSLFNYLTDYSIVITPHKFSQEIREGVKYGHFNVSFQIFKNDKSGQECLACWRKQCLEWCGDHYDEINNRFADQKYLDAWPASYPGRVKVLDDHVSGIAPWNLNNYSLKKKNRLFYSNNERIIFYHFHQFKFISDNWASHGFNEYKVKYKRQIGKLYLKYWNQVNKYNKRLLFKKDHSIRYKHSEITWERLQIENFVYFKITNSIILNIQVRKLPLIVRKIMGKLYA